MAITLSDGKPDTCQWVLTFGRLPSPLEFYSFEEVSK
jgi:hypothetical protein